MLGLDNPIHILFLLVVLLLVFGAKRLPELGRSLGSGLRGFKETLSGEQPRAELGPGAHAHSESAGDTPAGATHSSGQPTPSG
jgi:sec-independent protein translocase protein TatA